MLEAVDNNNDDNDNHDVVGQKRLGSVKARDTPAVVTSATSEVSDVRRTLRIGRVIVAKRAATTTTSSDDDDISDICTTKSTA